MESVYFPVTVREFGARLVFRDLREETLQFGAVRIDTMLLRAPGLLPRLQADLPADA